VERLAHIKQPPTTFFQRLRFLGPSLILTAGIVGSGELIMTTTLGAKAGFTALWVILLSCLFKVTVQLEFGKHAISSGETSLQAFNELKGPRIKGVSWSIWVWLLIKTFQMVQYGGIVGGVVLIIQMIFPSVPVWLAVASVCISVLLLVYHGKYVLVEKTSLFLIGGFSLFTIFCVFMLRYTPYSVSIENLAEGLSFKLPASMIGVALAAFGLTGVSADEVITYPYWCLEKGYAQYTGKFDQTQEWTDRAKGWIRVMYLDGIISMVIYTVATCAFYVLGAAILHSQGLIPEGYALIKTLSHLYTDSLGNGTMWVFLLGALMTLYSTLFVANASAARMYSDAMSILGLFDYSDERKRFYWIRFFACILPVLWGVLFLTIQTPVFMVMIGGISLTILLLLVAYSAILFRYKRLPEVLKPGVVYDSFFWLSIATILGLGIYTVSNL